MTNPQEFQIGKIKEVLGIYLITKDETDNENIVFKIYYCYNKPKKIIEAYLVTSNITTNFLEIGLLGIKIKSLKINDKVRLLTRKLAIEYYDKIMDIILVDLANNAVVLPKIIAARTLDFSNLKKVKLTIFNMEVVDVSSS